TCPPDRHACRRPGASTKPGLRCLMRTHFVRITLRLAVRPARPSEPCGRLGCARRLATVRTVTVLTAILLIAGCQRSPKPPPPRPAQAPAVQATDQAVQAAAGTKKEEPKKDRFPLDQEQFKAAVMGSTREQLLAKYGPPDEVLDLPAGVGWDGPVSIYRGPFPTADGHP